MNAPRIHPTASIADDAVIEDGVFIWDFAKVREHAQIGAGTILGQNVYVDHGVKIGPRCKVQNNVSIYHGVRIGAEVFVGPHATFTNDRVPRAFGESWTVTPTVVEEQSSIGANATIVCGVTLGRACMVGAGAVVTTDVPPFALVLGNPARVVDYVELDGRRRHVGPDGGPAELAD